jgi:cytoskeletal protein CcmA (bactofilin family)
MQSNKRLRAVLLALSLVLLSGPGLAQPASAPAGDAGAAVEHAGDRFVAGSWVSVDSPVVGDLIAAGSRVEVGADVSGDALLAGGEVRVGGTVGDSLYASGGQVALRGRVVRNARLAGGRVEIERGAEVTGNASIGGGQVTVAGAVNGYLQAAGGRVRIDGPVGGNVTVTAARIELGPDARIAGRLRYAARGDLERDPAAQVLGPVERMPERSERRPDPQPEQAGPGRWLWMAGLMLTALVLVAVLPGATARVARMLRASLGMSLLAGFILLVCVPVAALMLVFTLIGIPLALLLLMLYAALLIAGYVMAGVGLGDALLHKLHAAWAQHRAWRIVAALVGVAAITLLARLPWVGNIVVFLALIGGLGAMSMQVWRGRARQV